MNTKNIESKLLDAVSLLSEVKNLKTLDNGDEHYGNAIASKEHELYCKVRSLNDAMEDELAAVTGKATSPAEAIMAANRKLEAYLPGFCHQNQHTVAEKTQGYHNENY